MSFSEPPSNPTEWPSAKAVRWTLLIEILLLAIFAFGAVQAWQQSGSRIEDWLPESFQETKILKAFKSQFGSDEMLIVGWPGAKLGSSEVDDFVRRLECASQEGDVGTCPRYFDEVISGNSVLKLLTEPPNNLGVPRARAAMRGWILGEDDDTFVIARVNAFGTEHRQAAVEFVRESAKDIMNLDEDSIHIAGATADVVAVDEASKASLLYLNVLSAVVCISLLTIGTRNLFLGSAIFGIAALWQMGAMALIYYTGGRMDNVLLLTANLCGVLSMSASIHTVNYFRDAVEHHRELTPTRYAFMTALHPTLLAALTTAIGFGSLVVSQIGPVWNFGFYSMIAAPVAVTLTLWFLTVSLRIGRYQYTPSPTALSKALEYEGASLDKTAANRPSRPFIAILVVTALAMVIGGLGLMRLETAVGMHDLLPKNNKLLADYAWLENRVGPLVPVEVVLEMPVTPDTQILKELHLVRQVQTALASIDDVNVTISALNFSVNIPSPDALRGTRGVVQRVVFERQLEKFLSHFESLNMLHTQNGVHMWRVTARVRGGVKQDYESVLRRIRTSAEQAVNSQSDIRANVVVSGIVPLTVKTQDRLIIDMATSFGCAILLIGVTIAVVFRSLAAGMILMIPNFLPAVVVFGTMGWLSIRCEIAGVMTAGAVLGIVVDDSVHLIMMMRAYNQRGYDRHTAMEQAVRVCRPAMIQTSLVCGLGMLVFAASPFTPIQRFAWIMATLLAVALAGDLFVLPALVRSPVGKYLEAARGCQSGDNSGIGGLEGEE